MKSNTPTKYKEKYNSTNEVNQRKGEYGYMPKLLSPPNNQIKFGLRFSNCGQTSALIEHVWVIQSIPDRQCAWFFLLSDFDHISARVKKYPGSLSLKSKLNVAIDSIDVFFSMNEVNGPRDVTEGVVNNLLH